MSRLPSISKLIVEDFPEQKSWAGKLFQPLNTFMEQVYSALNRSLTLKDNMAADIITAELDGQMPLKIAWTLKNKPTAVLVGDCYRTDGTALSLVDPVGVRWSFTQSGQLQIDQILGVTPSGSAKHKVTLVCFTG